MELCLFGTHLQDQAQTCMSLQGQLLQEHPVLHGCLVKGCWWAAAAISFWSVPAVVINSGVASAAVHSQFHPAHMHFCCTEAFHTESCARSHALVYNARFDVSFMYNAEFAAWL